MLPPLCCVNAKQQAYQSPAGHDVVKASLSHKLSVRLTERKISQYISCPYLQIKRLVFADSWRICGEMYLRLCHLLFIISSRTRALHGWMLFHSDIIWESTKLLTPFAYHCFYDVNLEFILHFIYIYIYSLLILSSFCSAMHKPSSLRVSLVMNFGYLVSKSS